LRTHPLRKKSGSGKKIVSPSKNLGFSSTRSLDFPAETASISYLKVGKLEGSNERSK
jgi:hypothetical protein